MQRYTGKKCKVCEENFHDDDDIVICPDCGTPYHRDCYKNAGKCVNEELHLKGEAWKQEETPSTSTEKKPENRCRALPKNDNEIHDKGIQFEKNIVFNPEDEYFGLSPDEIFDEETKITNAEIMDFVDTNRFFYTLAFKKLQNALLKISINLIAFIFPEYYFAGRKMYGTASVIFIIRFILLLPVQLYTFGNFMMPELAEYIDGNGAFKRGVDILPLVDRAMRVAIGLVANQIYFTHTKKKIVKIKQEYADSEKCREVIRLKGGISVLSVVVFFLIHAFALSIIIFVFSMLLSF